MLRDLREEVTNTREDALTGILQRKLKFMALGDNNLEKLELEKAMVFFIVSQCILD